MALTGAGFGRSLVVMWPLRMPVLIALLLIAASPADAARPVKGALYVDYSSVANLWVSENGRSFSPRSTVTWEWTCAPTIRVGSRRNRVHITKGGRFGSVERTGGWVFRVKGRFATSDRVRLNYRILRRGNQCKLGSRKVTAYRAGAPLRFRDCRTHKAKTLLRTATGRVFQDYVWRARRSGPEGTNWIDAAFACLFSESKAVELGQDDDDDYDLDDFRLAGPYVAYEEQGCVGLGCGSGVIVRDLRDGRKVREAPDAFSDTFGSVTDLELKENGSVAWMGSSTVWASDSLGTRLLDEGPDLVHGSLELNGSALSWVNGAVSRSATLE